MRTQRVSDNSVFLELIRAGRWAEADRILRQMLRADEHLDAFLYAVGQAYRRTEHVDRVMRALDIALAARPDSVRLYNALGAMHTRLDNEAGARDAFAQALRIAPSDALTHTNFARLHYGLQRYAEAEAEYRTALENNPGFAGARYGLAECLLNRGELSEGFELYESRWEAYPHLKRDVELPEPAGDAVPERIAVYCEQGLGDLVQFGRYVPMLQQRGWRVAATADANARPLLSRLGAHTSDAALGACRHALSLCSLPRFFGTELSTIPAGYATGLGLAPAPARSGTRLRVGICWAGSPTHPNDAQRSAQARMFRRLVRSDVQLVSLQRGHTRRQWPGRGKVDLDTGREALGLDQPPLDDLDATLAAIAGLDLVVSVDTLVAHLAGAAGVPVWVLLPFNADWRWLNALPEFRERSPWYPSMTLFRQRRPGEWEEVFEEVERALGDFR
jgi:tetratricopeptide (TPR) repeat protein